MSPVGTRMASGHTAKAPDGVQSWSRNVTCVVEGCGRKLVWVQGSSHKPARWQHERA